MQKKKNILENLIFEV